MNLNNFLLKTIYCIFILLLITGMNVKDVFADKYLKVPPGGNYRYGNVVNIANATASDDVYAVFYPDGSTDGNHALGNNNFAIGYTEGSYGYIHTVNQFGIEYHLWPIKFSNDFMEGWFSTRDASSWIGGWFPDAERPLVDATVVSLTEFNGDNDYHYTKVFTQDQERMDRWGEINGNYWGYGLWCDLCWYHRPASTNADPTNIYVDYIYINVMVKLTVTGTDKTPVTASQGSMDVPILLLNFKPYSNTTFDINNLRVDINGTCAASDIDLIKFYRDIDSDGTVSTGDILMGSVDPGVTKADRDISFSPIINDVPHNSKWLLAVDISDTATVGATIGLDLDSESDLTPVNINDKVASNTDRTAAGTAGDPDPNPLWPISSGTVTVKQKATLSAIFTTPATSTVTMGDNITVTMRVSNAAGAETANDVLPSALSLGGTGNAVTSTSFLSQDITGGSFYDFVWTYQAIGNGTVNFTGNTSGKDADSGITQTSNSPVSNTVTINYAAVPILQITSFTVSPTTLSNDNQTLTVSVDVKNVGTGTATNVGIFNSNDDVLWSLFPNGTASFNDTTGALSQKDINEGSTENWLFTLNATGSGTSVFEAYADGDNVTNAVYSSSELVTVESKALVENVSIATSPTGDIGKNATFVVAITVKNNGEAVAENVIPREPVVNEIINGDPDPIKNGGPFPVASTTLGPGEEIEFSWSFYSKGGTIINGEYTISVITDYVDENSGYSRNTGAQTSAQFRVTNTITPIAQNSTTTDVRKLIAYTYDSQYYVVNEASRLYAYNTLGQEKWNVDLTTWFTVPGETIVVTVENGKNVIWMGSQNGRVYAVQDNGGSASGFYDVSIGNSWLSLGTGDPVNTGPIVYGDYVYCSGKYHFAKRMKADGTIPTGWADYETPNDITTSASIDNNNIYLGCADGRMYSLNVSTGALRNRSGSYGSAISTDPFIYTNVITTGNDDGEIIKFADPTSLNKSVTTQALSGTGPLSDLWVGLNGDFVWVTDETGGNLYKVDYTNLASFTTKNIGGTLYGPIEYLDKVYICGVTAGGQGEVYVLDKATLNSIDPLLWPYQVAGNAFRTPVSLDPWNNVFLTGCDDNNLYMFSLPE